MTLCGEEALMKIKWYGHAAFLITSDRGVKIMTDPYDPDAYAEKLTKPIFPNRLRS